MSSFSLKCKTFLLGIITTVLMASPGFADIDMTLNIVEIPGNIDIERCDYSMGTPASSRDRVSGMSSGKRQSKSVTLTSIDLTREFDRFSPELMKACAEGLYITQAELRFRVQGSGTNFLTITMTDCLISSYASSTSERDDEPTESITLSFASAKFVFNLMGPSEQPIITELLFGGKPTKK